MSVETEVRRFLGRLRLRHLELLHALGQDPNLGRCATRLNMTQPTASKLLREIEDIFGAVLFERNRRGLSPTPAGVAMTRRATLLVGEARAALEELQSSREGATGRLRLGVFPVAIPEFLPTFCCELDALWPGLTLILEEGIEDKLLNDLNEGQLDCVFGRVVPELLGPELYHERLYREPTAIICGPEHPMAQMTESPELLQHLKEASWILPASQGAVYNLVASRLGQLGLPAPKVTFETSSVFTTVEMIRRRNLLSVLPFRLAQSYVEGGQVARVQISALVSSYAVGVIMRRGGDSNVMMQAVLSAARRAATHLGLGTY